MPSGGPEHPAATRIRLFAPLREVAPEVVEEPDMADYRKLRIEGRIMSVHRFRPSDPRFARIRPPPPGKVRGVPRVDGRRAVSGIVRAARLKIRRAAAGLPERGAFAPYRTHPRRARHDAARRRASGGGEMDGRLGVRGKTLGVDAPEDAPRRHAVAQPADSASACSSTVRVAFSCLSGG